MLFGMSDYIQSVVMDGRLYVGGGYTEIDKNKHRVMVYDLSLKKWGILPPYRAVSFAMVVINYQLVLVGGCESGFIKILGVWEAYRSAWSHPYPEMPTARSRPSVLAHKEWLVVAGGQKTGACVSCVEVLNTDNKQWYTGPPTPIPWCNMRTAVAGDMAYVMGGVDQTYSNTRRVYCIDIQMLLSNITSKAFRRTEKQIWKEIPELQLTNSTPLVVNGSLLAVGGQDKDWEAVTAIHLYQPDEGEWMKVGDLPSPRSSCTCTMTTDREVFVAGGQKVWGLPLKRVDSAEIA